MKKARNLVTVGMVVAGVTFASISAIAASSGGYGSPPPAAPAPAATAVPADVAKKLSDLLMKAPAEGHWQVSAADLSKMMTEKKTDFVVVDVRPQPPGQQGGKIPGAVFIPYNEILADANLKKLPRDKKLILACVTGQTQNLPVLALRALGYNAYTLKFGHASWVKGYLGAGLMQEAIAGASYQTLP